MVQIHSPRPFPLEPIFTDIYIFADRLVSDQERQRFKLNRSDNAISRSLIDLHCDGVMFGHTWNLSNLSNTCPTISPTDKESVYSG